MELPVCPECGATRRLASVAARCGAYGRRPRVRRCPAGQGWHLIPDRPARCRCGVRRSPRDSGPAVHLLLAGGHRVG